MFAKARVGRDIVARQRRPTADNVHCMNIQYTLSAVGRLCRATISRPTRASVNIKRAQQ